MGKIKVSKAKKTLSSSNNKDVLPVAKLLRTMPIIYELEKAVAETNCGTCYHSIEGVIKNLISLVKDHSLTNIDSP